MDRQQFIDLRSQYLTSAAPIQSPEYLKGRESALSGLVDALQAPGRHAFIYGYRGVGKTSLAQTTAYQLQSAVGEPIIISCDPDSTYISIINDVVSMGRSVNPLNRKSRYSIDVSGTAPGIGGASVNIQPNTNADVRREISTVNETVSELRQITKEIGRGLIVVIDEFDQIRDKSQHQYFASIVKAVSDNHVDVRLIFCGVADTVDSLFHAHGSIYRQVHSEKVDRLSLQARLDILDSASTALDIAFTDTQRYRIAQISDGFPSFVHLIGEKAITNAFDNNLDQVSVSAYEIGLKQAIKSVDVKLKDQYETALHKNTKKYEHVIWSVAAEKLLVVNVETVWQNYIEIMDQIRQQPLSRANINTKLNQLCDEKYAYLLSKPRRSNFTFTEQMMRAYARLRAEDSGCELGKESP